MIVQLAPNYPETMRSALSDANLALLPDPEGEERDTIERRAVNTENAEGFNSAVRAFLQGLRQTPQRPTLQERRG